MQAMSVPRRRLRIPRPCLDCGRKTRNGTRCVPCSGPVEAARQARQPYRVVYRSRVYRRNRAIAIRKAGGRCVRVVDGERCIYPAQETNHRIPLSTARSLEEALALCSESNLEPVCWRHNPRLGHKRARPGEEDG